MGLAALATLSLVGAPSASAELTERGDLFVNFQGGIAPDALPRQQLAPITVSVAGTVKTLSGERPPALRRIRIALNRGGRLNALGLPRCRYKDLVASSSRQALQTCGGALVGEGAYAARTAFPEQDAFPSNGRILAFNSVYRGQTAILAHVYGADPVPITRIITFRVRRTAGTYGTVLTGELPVSINRYGYIQAIVLRLHRTYVHRGRDRSYLSAACAAPPGFPGALFPFARASMTFEDGRTISSTLIRTCKVST